LVVGCSSYQTASVYAFGANLCRVELGALSFRRPVPESLSDLVILTITKS